MQECVSKHKSSALLCDICSRFWTRGHRIQHNAGMPEAVATHDIDRAPQGVRARARAQLLGDVSRIARNHLAESGAPGLSVRAIARELGLASSALYRYYPSRDALLTQLIVESYNELGAVVEAAEAACDRHDVGGRFRASAHAVRDWARSNPNEYALIYGSPVPGYAAPQDTVDPATRVTMVLGGILADIHPDAPILRPPREIPSSLQTQLDAMSSPLGEQIDQNVLLLGVTLWAKLFGMINFELFGTFNTVFDDADALFAASLDLDLAALGVI
jgi:AcrR family transcriptional regulator